MKYIAAFSKCACFVQGIIEIPTSKLSFIAKNRNAKFEKPDRIYLTTQVSLLSTFRTSRIIGISRKVKSLSPYILCL